MTLRVLDLFSGIGGFSLGLERAGMQTVAFCEIEPFARRVLAKHWPKVPIYGDVRELTADALRRDGITVDVICGGFPCQDVSLAGKRVGIEGERTGLWREFRRLIGELRPRYVLAENVPGILSSGAGVVLGDLAALGYNALWECIPASALGAPHRRDRWWLVAHPDGGDACAERQQRGGEQRQQPEDRGAGWLADADCEQRNGGGDFGSGRRSESSDRRSPCGVANSSGAGLEVLGEQSARHQCATSERGRAAGGMADAPGVGWREECEDAIWRGSGDQAEGRAAGSMHSGGRCDLGDAESVRLLGRADNQDEGWWQSSSGFSGEANFWADREWVYCTDHKWRPIEPGTFPLAHGVPERLAKCRAAGNSVVPIIPEILARTILVTECARRQAIQVERPA